MSEKMSNGVAREDMLRMMVDIVSSYVSRNPLSIVQLEGVIETVFSSLISLGEGTDEVKVEAQKPAVNPRKSIAQEYIVCLEDGKKLKMLKRYLRTNYNMTPDQYRTKWGLPSDYPMVAPNYSQQRSDFAKKAGLGQKIAGGAIRRRRGSAK